MVQSDAEITTLYSAKSARRAQLVAENAYLRRLCAISDAKLAGNALMLREADHRIKNSLQVVASLINVQAMREENISARDALRGAAARVHTIARIHDALQSYTGDELVDIGEAIEALCLSLHAMAGDQQGVSILVTAGRIVAPAALVQPILLAINELVINAMRHAFPDNRQGTVRVTVTGEEDLLRIVVADDGQGLAGDPGGGRGYGMQLVQMIARQIDAAITFESRKGARIELTIPLVDRVRVS